MRRSRWLLALTLVGCAGTEAQTKTQLERQVQDLRRQTDADRHALHELENRIFLLEDKLDTAEVARSKVGSLEPRLPVVTKHRPNGLDEGPIAIEDPPAPTPPAYDDDSGGPDGPPVILQLDENGAPRASFMDDPRPAGARPTHRRQRPVLPELASINERLPVAPLPPRPAASSSKASGDAMMVYQDARAALGRREHAAAIAGFKRFVEAWPGHDYADNAQYWLGEAYYDQSDYKTALVEFRAVIQRYPSGNKAPDALLKVGYCLAKLGDAAGAADALAQVQQIYPKTEAAKLASERLEAKP